MPILNASEARADLYRLIDRANESHEPLKDNPENATW